MGQRESSEDWYNQGELPGGSDTSRWILKEGRSLFFSKFYLFLFRVMEREGE